MHKGGDPDLQFDVGPTNDGSGWQDTEMGPLPAAVDDYINGERVNTIKALQDVVEIDDDNEPAPENVPQTSNNNNQVFGEWGHTGLCGNPIIQHFGEKDVEATEALLGKLDDVPFHVHCMKEPDYVMMLMSTYGTLAEVSEEKNDTTK